MKTIIIGGGTIGLLTAHELVKRGRQVVILDKGNLAEGASLGNAGWVTPSLSGPVPAPGLVAQSLGWMFRSDSPLYISPLAVPSMLGWLFSFWRHCNYKSYQAGFTALAELNQRTMADFDALEAEGFEFEMHRNGLLFVAREEKTVRTLLADFTELARYGFGEPVRFSEEETLNREPALRRGIAGSVLMPAERHVRPESLNDAAISWLRDHQVELRPRTTVTGFEVSGGKVTGVHTDTGSIAAEQVLIATGAEAAFLCRQVGVRMPMQAGKGYSLTVDRPKLKVRGPMYVNESRLAISPLAGSLRIAGTMELSGVNNKLDRRRLASIRKGADMFLDGWEEGGEVTEWVGMRPMLPDGLPAIGRLPGQSNVFIASGHAMLGITLGPTTAVAVAELMNEEEGTFNLRPYDPGRFTANPGRFTALRRSSGKTDGGAGSSFT